jgi:hypothetical protein
VKLVKESSTESRIGRGSCSVISGEIAMIGDTYGREISRVNLVYICIRKVKLEGEAGEGRLGSAASNSAHNLLQHQFQKFQALAVLVVRNGSIVLLQV